MEKRTQLLLSLEIIFWLVTAIVVFLVMRPIFNVLTSFKFSTQNIVYIIIFVTYTRFLFLLEYTFFAKNPRIKVLLIIASIPLAFYCINHLNSFQTHLDEQGPDVFLQYLKRPLNQQAEQNLLAYIYNEYLFFGVASSIVVLLMPFRMLISLWRTRNRGMV